ELEGDAPLPEHLAQQEQVALGILLLAKDSGDDGPGRIVDRGEQAAVGMPCPEPLVPAAINLQQHPRLRHPVPATAVAWCSPFPGGSDAGLPSDALDRLASQQQAIARGEQVAEMTVVAAGISAAHELDDLAAHAIGDPPWGGTATIAVGQGYRSFAAVAS